jgi:hypothetical protein
MTAKEYYQAVREYGLGRLAALWEVVRAKFQGDMWNRN